MKADERLTRKTRLKAWPEARRVFREGEEGFLPAIKMASVPVPREPDREALAAFPYTFTSDEDVFSWCAALVADSPTASRLWIDAEREGWSLALGDLGNGGFHLDFPLRLLVLDNFALTPAALGRSPYFRNALITTLIRALRDLWHEHRSGAFETVYDPEATLMLERVRAADCDTVTILAGWELRGAGYGDVWRHLIGAEEGDMALVFSRVLERDPTALFDGAALSHAFRQWFADETRVDGCDHVTLESLDEILRACGGTACFGARRADAAAVENLARLTDGRSYLKGRGEAILRDPFFAGMRDPVNQTHLFHLMYDMEAFIVNNVPFRDRKLARRIFPEGSTTPA